MKNQMLFTVLAVMLVHASSAVVEPGAEVESLQVLDSTVVDAKPTSVSMLNLISGIISTGDKVLHRGFYSKPAGTATAVQTQDIVYRSALTTTRITYISALAVGATSSANAQITAGGINTNNVTIRLTSDRGQGYEFWVEVWGR